MTECGPVRTAWPCSNCVARSAACHFFVSPNKRPMDAGLVEHKTLSDVLHRIERLEQSLLPQQIVTTNPMVNKWLLTSDVQPACGAEINAAKDQDLEALESIATGHSVSGRGSHASPNSGGCAKRNHSSVSL